MVSSLVEIGKYVGENVWWISWPNHQNLKQGCFGEKMPL
jgi:hypothetical protein